MRALIAWLFRRFCCSHDVREIRRTYSKPYGGVFEMVSFDGGASRDRLLHGCTTVLPHPEWA